MIQLKNNLKLLILYIVGNYARESATNLRTVFNNSQTASNGSNFVNGYLEYVIYQKYATELANGYVQESTYDGLWNQIKNSFNGTDTTYDQFKKYFEDDISISNSYINQTINYYILHDTYYGDFSDNSSEIVDSGTSGNISWNLNKNGILNITGKGSMPDYSSYKQPWYSHATSIKQIIVNEGVTSIGNYAFSQTSIIKVILPSTVIRIGNGALENCRSLESIEIPNNVRSIGKYAFFGCTSLINAVIPNKVTSIEESTFEYCTKLKNIEIPNSITSIGEKAFYQCLSMTNIQIPNSVKSIGDSAFSCTCFTNINIPNSVIDIGPSAFSYCSKLKSVIIPNSVKNIGNRAFQNCKELTSIKISNSITSINNSAFYGCSNLTSVTIPQNVTSIGSSAFNRCTNLINVEIPNSVKYIGESAFYGCNSLIVKVYNNSTGLTYCKDNKIKYRIIGAFESSYNIQVESNIFDVDENIELKVEQIINGKDHDAIANYSSNFSLYDIGFYKDNEKVEIDGTAIVRIPVKEGMDGNKCKVYYNDNGTYTDMNAVYKDGYMEFKTDHFSQYVLTDNELPTTSLGDVNGDGEINFLDAIMVLRHDAEIIELEENQLKAADVNKDGEVNFLDAIMILRYDAEIIDSFN